MKTIIVTGASSGIGFAVCKALLRQKYKVIGIGHSELNCKKAVDSLKELYPASDISFLCGDLMQQTEIKRLAERLSQILIDDCGGELDVLINNAGCVRSWYTTTEDGYEQQFALNHLAGFRLSHYLLPYLKKAGGRILFTSSNSHKMMKMRWKDPMFQQRYSPLMAYKQSKLCNVLTAFSLNERYNDDGIRAYAIDPGLVKTDIGNKQTGGLVDFIWRMRKRFGTDADIPARTYLYLCMHSEHPDGLYYYNSNIKKHSRQVNKENAERLFALSEQLCGIEYGD